MLGELLGLLTALVWCISTFIYQKYSQTVTIPANYTNFLKCLLALLIMTTYHLLFYFQFPNILEFQNKKNLLIILLSGIIGIGFGDNFLFLALKILGSQKLLILETMCPTLTCIIAYFYLGNPILFYQYIGIFITIFGIYLVIITNKSLPLEEKLIINNLEYLKNLHNKPEFKGYIYSFIFNICTVFGGIMSYQVLQEEQSLSTFNTTYLRLLGGEIYLVIMMIFQKETFVRYIGNKQEKSYLFLAIIFGTIVGISCQQLSYKYTRPEIANTMFSTSPLFGLIIQKLNKQDVYNQQILGSIIAVVGVFFIFQAK